MTGKENPVQPEMTASIAAEKRDKFDIVDLIDAGLETEAIRAAAEAACEPIPGSVETEQAPGGDSNLADADIDAEIERLSVLPLVTYERQRAAAAQRLGLRTTVLDNLVKGRRQAGAARGQGQPLDLPMPEPWPEPVDGAELLGDITAAILKYVVMEEGAEEAVALWILHAHAIDAFPITPRLAITSPEKRCGKTTFLDAIQFLTPRPLFASNVTTAAIFRTIETARPTLLIDEADTFLTNNDEMRGVLNSGHRRSGAFVLRLVGDNHEPRQFSTWAAVAIALIGTPPDTLVDRSILIRMRRRLPSEKVAPFRADRSDGLAVLARKAVRWAKDNIEALRGVDPTMPSAITNRDADNWRPLLAVADAAGGEWPARARALAKMMTGKSEREPQSLKIMLLEDIRDVFAKEGVDKLPSADLVQRLVAMKDRPWSESGPTARPITQNKLAGMLKDFRIRPDDIWMGNRPLKGYQLGQFADAFQRYLSDPPVQPARTLGDQQN